MIHRLGHPSSYHTPAGKHLPTLLRMLCPQVFLPWMKTDFQNKTLNVNTQTPWRGVVFRFLVLGMYMSEYCTSISRSLGLYHWTLNFKPTLIPNPLLYSLFFFRWKLIIIMYAQTVLPQLQDFFLTETRSTLFFLVGNSILQFFCIVQRDIEVFTLKYTCSLWDKPLKFFISFPVHIFVRKASSPLQYCCWLVC